MEIKEIQDLIRFVAKSGVSEVELEKEGFKIHIKTGAVTPVSYQAAPVALPPVPVILPPAPVSAAGSPLAVPETAPAAPKAHGTPVKAPMVGTFYRSSGPDKEPFVKVGDRVQKGQTLCIIEAMKLFNEIEAEFGGVVQEILVDNAVPVEYDQTLFVVAQEA